MIPVKQSHYVIMFSGYENEHEKLRAEISAILQKQRKMLDKELKGYNFHPGLGKM